MHKFTDASTPHQRGGPPEEHHRHGVRGFCRDVIVWSKAMPITGWKGCPSIEGGGLANELEQFLSPNNLALSLLLAVQTWPPSLFVEPRIHKALSPLNPRAAPSAPSLRGRDSFALPRFSLLLPLILFLPGIPLICPPPTSRADSRLSSLLRDPSPAQGGQPRMFSRIQTKTRRTLVA